RLAVQLLYARQQMRTRSAVRVVRGALMRVLAVGEVEYLVEREDERLRKRLAFCEPRRDGRLVRRRRRERLGREFAARFGGDFAAGVELVEDEAVAVR